MSTYMNKASLRPCMSILLWCPLNRVWRYMTVYQCTFLHQMYTRQCCCVVKRGVLANRGCYEKGERCDAYVLPSPAGAS